VSIEQAQAGMDAIAASLAARYADSNKNQPGSCRAADDDVRGGRLSAGAACRLDRSDPGAPRRVDTRNI